LPNADRIYKLKAPYAGVALEQDHFEDAVQEQIVQERKRLSCTMGSGTQDQEFNTLGIFFA
jgi:hypothetical protein